uniref:Uncharacterized protein n=1 Tax=Anopheles maculatus TaxID=74869 RepID=A0A182ST46_9DIPT
MVLYIHHGCQGTERNRNLQPDSIARKHHPEDLTGKPALSDWSCCTNRNKANRSIIGQRKASSYATCLWREKRPQTTVKGVASRNNLLMQVKFINSFLHRFLSWDVVDCHVDLEEELHTITLQALEGEEGKH